MQKKPGGLFMPGLLPNGTAQQNRTSIGPVFMQSNKTSIVFVLYVFSVFQLHLLPLPGPLPFMFPTICVCP